MSEVPARGANGVEYPSWDAMVTAEANGYVVVGIISNGRQSWPWVIGPFPSQREANNARARSRNQFRREVAQGYASPKATAKWFVRPAWRADR